MTDDTGFCQMTGDELITWAENLTCAAPRLHGAHLVQRINALARMARMRTNNLVSIDEMRDDPVVRTAALKGECERLRSEKRDADMRATAAHAECERLRSAGIALTNENRGLLARIHRVRDAIQEIMR